jgi:hypothetical protein
MRRRQFGAISLSMQAIRSKGSQAKAANDKSDDLTAAERLLIRATLPP